MGTEDVIKSGDTVECIQVSQFTSEDGKPMFPGEVGKRYVVRLDGHGSAILDGERHAGVYLSRFRKVAAPSEWQVRAEKAERERDAARQEVERLMIMGRQGERRLRDMTEQRDLHIERFNTLRETFRSLGKACE